MAVPIIQSSASFADTSNQTSRTINKPTGTASGDLLILSVSIDAAATVTTPTGFTLERRVIEPSGSMSLYQFYRVADGTEGATFTIDSTSEYATGVILRITGAESTGYLDTFSTAKGELDTSSVAYLPDVYASGNDSLILSIIGVDGGSITVGTPSGFTSVVNQTGGTSGTTLAVASKDQASAGYVGANSATISSATEEYCAITMVVRSTTSTVASDFPILKNFEYVMPATGVAGTYDLPHGTASGDTLLLLQEADVNSFTTTGYTLIQESNVSTTIYSKSYYRVADGSEASTFTGLPSATGSRIGVLARVTNADTSSPIDQSSVATGTNTEPTATSITPTVNNSLIIWQVGADDADLTFNSGYPSGFTGILAVGSTEGSDSTLMLARLNQTTAAATGSMAGSLTVTEEWVATAFSIKPYVAPSSSGETTEIYIMY